MIIRIAELRVNYQQALEIVPDSQFFSHAHATVQLHRIFTNKDRRLSNQVL